MHTASFWHRVTILLILSTAMSSPALAGTLEGTVTDAVSGEPVQGALVELYRTDFILYRSTSADFDGHFAFDNLPTDEYIILTIGAGYIPEAYDDVLCHPQRGCPISSKITKIPVTAGSTTRIDIEIHRGARVSGRITDAMTGEPVSTAVSIYDPVTRFLATPNSSETGEYSSGLIPAGTYYVRTNSLTHQNELYDDVRCPFQASCDWLDGTPIELDWGESATGIDLALERFGAIGGTVTERVTGEPIGVAYILVRKDTGDQFSDGYSRPDGTYLVGGLRPGSYTVEVDHHRYQGELYDDIPCDDCDPSEGMLITVDFNTTVGDVDFALERYGSISGTISQRTTGEPIEGASVSIWDEAGEPAGFGNPDETGAYTAENLPPGNYYATVQDIYHRGELYDDIPCEGCDPTGGTPIAVELNTDTGEIDFALERLGSISGRATHSITGQPLQFVNVEVYDATGALVGMGETDTSGDYLVQGLQPGDHFAVATGALYLDELYDGLPCEGGCDPTAGMPIATSLNTVTTGIDFTLDQLGSIGGRVANDRRSVRAARVVIYDSSGAFQRDTFTNHLGRYVVDTLPAGTYFAVVEHDVFVDELYDNLPCEGGCDPTTGTPIEVDINSVPQDVDFDVGYCTPTATSLCLTGDRFRVEAQWEDFANDMGSAAAETLTTDAGTFWFFNPNNVELVVKVLDICLLPENRFWVFAAGLTNVGVELQVTDELTGEVVTYSNPLGTTYETVIDTQAFDTCDAGASAADVGSAVSPEPLLAVPPRGLPSADPPAAAVPNKGNCVQTDTKLCLNGGRFMAEVTWEASEGIGGAARTRPLTDESGYFWFGDAQNVEIVVKVLDACGLPSFQNYWVFGAGLTNFDVTLRVTDTETGEVQEYFNPQGRTFETITDLGNFMTCP